MDTLPAFEPLMLSGLAYTSALKQQRATGCALRRPHWCQPILVNTSEGLMMDDEGEFSPWEPSSDDERARDWQMVAALTERAEP
jgi:hypothetical protein